MPHEPDRKLLDGEQLLFQGRHPYSGIHADGTMPSPAEAIRGNRFAYAQQPRGVRPPPQTLLLSDLPAEVVTLFERAFAPAAGGRPTGKEWDQGLAALSQALVACPQDAHHRHVRGKRCPWCAHNQGATAKGGFAPGAKRLNVNQELNRIWQGVQAIPRPAAPMPVPAPATVTPLALQLPSPPVLETAELPARRLRAARTRRTLAVLLFLGAAGLLWRGGSVTAELGLGLLAWILFATSSGRRIKAAQLRRQRDRHRTVILQYEDQKRELLSRLLTSNAHIQTKLMTLTSRQQSESALRKYQAALKGLEDRRASIRSLASGESTALQQVRDRHREAALEQYLRRQLLVPGQVNGIGPGLIANLQQKGVRTAWDVTDQVRWIGGIGPRRAGDLTRWRRTQENFFTFDPASVPAAELSAAVAAHDQKLLAQLQLLAAEAGKLALDVKTWAVLDQVVANDIRAQLTEAEQCRLGLRQLEALWP